MDIKQLYPAILKKRGGGVAFFLKNNINGQIVKKLETNSVQLLTVAIKTIKEQIWFSCVYMPPKCTNEANFLTVDRYLDSLMIDPETKHVICGDFNINFLINSKKAKSLKNLLTKTMSQRGYQMAEVRSLTQFFLTF